MGVIEGFMKNMSGSNLYRSFTLDIKPGDDKFISGSRRRLRERVESFVQDVRERHPMYDLAKNDIHGPLAFSDQEILIQSAVRRHAKEYIPGVFS